MRNDDIFRRIAPYAGMAGGILLFAAAGVALVAGHINTALVWLLVAAGLLLIFFVAADTERVVQALTGRRARYGSNAGVMSVAFIGIFIIFNFLATSHNQQWDLTQGSRNTLTAATVQLIKGLKQPVQIIAFYGKNQTTGGAGRQDAENLLNRYQALSPQLTFTVIDPDANPGQAQKYNVTAVPTLVIISGSKQQQVQIADEQDISSAIEKVVSGKTPRLYFLQGHGEPDLAPAGGPSFSQLIADLKKNNFDAQPLNLLTVAKVPADAALVVEASPTTAYSADQQKLLLDYLAQGGHLLVLAGPFPKADLNWLVKPYGVSIDSGLVVDLDSAVSGQPQAVVVQSYQQGPMLTGPLPPGVYLDTTALTTLSPAPAGVTVSPVAKTSPNSYQLTDPNATSIDPSKDKKGPFTIIASIEKGAAAATATPTPVPAAAPTAQSPSSRLVVFGDTAFVTDGLMQQNAQIAEGNSEAAIAAIKWLAEEPGQITIPTKTPQDHSMLIVGWQTKLLIFANALFVPALVLLAGVAVWLRRR